MSSPLRLTFIILVYDVLMKSPTVSLLIHLPVPAGGQRSGRIRRDRPRSPGPEGLLPLTT